jgi:universal stress protein A
MHPFTKILVPVDFSSDSAQAVRMAVELARRYEAALTLVHVYEPVAYAMPEGYLFFTQPQLDQLFAEFHRHLDALQAEARAGGVLRVETRLEQGFAASEICESAKRLGCDLIVMGTHGRTGLSHLFLGSVAERVLRMAACPVLTVKTKDRELKA